MPGSDGAWMTGDKPLWAAATQLCKEYLGSSWGKTQVSYPQNFGVCVCVFLPVVFYLARFESRDFWRAPGVVLWGTWEDLPPFISRHFFELGERSLQTTGSDQAAM